MSVLITGGGLVGSQIARLEQEAGRTPVIFDSSPNAEALSDFVDLTRCVIVRGDVCNPLDLVGAVHAHGVRRIVHTAAFGGLLRGSNAAPLTSTMVNTMGAAYVLETARILGLERVVLASSSALYVGVRGGEDGGAFGREEAYPRPVNVYAANKQAAEDLGRAYWNTFGVDVVAVRYAGVFGPWRAGGGGVATTAMEDWLRGAMAGERVEVGNYGEDWLYSRDAAMGTYLACWAEGLENRVFNLGMGRNYDADDIATAINEAVPGGWATASAATTPAPPPMSTERARRQLAFEVEFPMEAAMRDYRDWIAGASGSGDRDPLERDR
jgi:nucleoside-diphosphate-sugar epimerase